MAQIGRNIAVDNNNLVLLKPVSNFKAGVIAVKRVKERGLIRVNLVRAAVLAV